MKISLAAALAVVCAAAAHAQQSGPPVSFADALKNKYNQNKEYLLASAEKWPEDQYTWRPAGLEAELRTFGQLIVHTANENTTQCARASGTSAPRGPDDTKGVFTKAEAIAILKASFAACDPVFGALTDQSLLETVKVVGSTRAPGSRGGPLLNDILHSNDQYGRIMVYFAMKGMVPPSHAK